MCKFHVMLDVQANFTSLDHGQNNRRSHDSSDGHEYLDIRSGLNRVGVETDH